MRYLKYLLFSYLALKVFCFLLVCFLLYKGYQVYHVSQVQQSIELQRYMYRMDSLRNSNH